MSHSSDRSASELSPYKALVASSINRSARAMPRADPRSSWSRRMTSRISLTAGLMTET